MVLEIKVFGFADRFFDLFQIAWGYRVDDDLCAGQLVDQVCWTMVCPINNSKNLQEQACEA